MNIKIERSLFDKSKVVSFDLFGTLFLRNVDHPTDIFYFVGVKVQGLTNVSAKTFRLIRIIAERFTRIYQRLFRRREEIDLEDIYKTISKLLFIEDKISYFIMQTEMDMENLFIYLNTSILPTVELCKKKGKKIIFISEMYLPFYFVFELLRKHKLIEYENQLYLSSNLRKLKKSGNLFDYAIQREGIKYDELLHVGDNYHSDVMVPAAKNIMTIHYENALPKLKWWPIRGCSYYYAGYLKSISTETYFLRKNRFDDEELCVLASYVAAPVLFSYVHWIMAKALKEGLERLYFIARDGEVLIKIAQELKKACGWNIDLRYIYGSRHSWLLPSIIEYDKLSEQTPFFKFAKNLTIRKLLLRFKLEKIDQRWLKRKVLEYNMSFDDQVSIANLHKVKRLMMDRAVLQEIRTIADGDFKKLSEYLGNEGLFDDVRYGIIDVGWRGTLPNALRNVFIKNGKSQRPMTVFYFDVFNEPLYKDLDRFRVFLREIDMQYLSPTRGELEVLMEFFTYATHASTYGFEEKEDMIHPVFMEEDLGSDHKNDVARQQEIIIEFARQLVRNPCFKFMAPKKIYHASLENLYAFLNKPGEALAWRINQFPYSPEQVIDANDKNKSFCASYHFSDFLELIRNLHVLRKNDVWIQGSLALTKNPITRIIFSMFYGILSLSIIKKLERMIRSRMGF